MLAGKKLTDYTNLFSLHDFKKNNIILPLKKIFFFWYNIKVKNN